MREGRATFQDRHLAILRIFLDNPLLNNYNAVVMNTKRLLGGFENLLLLAILRLDDRAYGVAIRQELLDQAEKDVAIGAIYTALDRLEQKGFVKSWTGEPTPERGGKAKKFYRVTAQGTAALNETHRALSRLSRGLKGSLLHV
jgi:DNA-binding PadR family transcriptional regulator